LDAERTRFKTQLDVLEQADRSFSGLNQGARYLLQASSRETGWKNPGTQRIYAGTCSVRGGYRGGVGEFLDGIILENTLQIEEVLLTP